MLALLVFLLPGFAIGTSKLSQSATLVDLRPVPTDNYDVFGHEYSNYSGASGYVADDEMNFCPIVADEELSDCEKITEIRKHLDLGSDINCKESGELLSNLQQCCKSSNEKRLCLLETFKSAKLGVNFFNIPDMQ